MKQYKYKEFISSNCLKEKRLLRGIRQKDVAEILGFCTPDRISHWEKGTAIPNLANLFRLSALYQVYPHEMYPELFNEALIENEFAIRVYKEKIKSGTIN